MDKKEVLIDIVIGVCIVGACVGPMLSIIAYLLEWGKW